nr:2-amino-4-hydroxy-6-hydroxymethyldihydropteridine diphosphokinase [Pseudothermotoga thermarum]
MGSNLENRLKNIQNACLLMEKRQIQIVRKSSIYETKPYGKTDQPDFLNCVVEVETTLTPTRLLENLLEIEKILGRVRTEKWGPRTIDLDILLYGNIVFETQNLTIPHYDLLNRQFFLVPLVELKVFHHPVEGDFSLKLKEGEECKLLTSNW